MNAENFAYWLNGFVELNGGKEPTPAQWKAIQEHLALVFKKVTPPVQTITGPEKGAPDPMARKSMADIVRECVEKGQNLCPCGSVDWSQQICSGASVQKTNGAITFC